MNIGLVGKPNVGKSTFFSAATLIDAEIANYPFTTIAANKGMGYVRGPCPCIEQQLPAEHSPQCEQGTRFIPVELIDVAGLIKGAHEGKGLGNQFLDDVRQASALIHVVDAAGATDPDGAPCAAGTHDPVQDVAFLENEITYWFRGILDKNWEKMKRAGEMRGEKLETAIAGKLAGLGITETEVKTALRHTENAEDQLLALADELRRLNKPMIIAANKADKASDEQLDQLRALDGYLTVPTCAEAELALRRAAKANLITYRPGDGDFALVDASSVREKQRAALDYIRENVLGRFGSTGVQECIEAAAYRLLKLIVAYPVEDEHKFTDKNGRVLPDAFLIKEGSTARDLAYKVHTDLGEKFIRAVDAKKKRMIGADHALENGDVVKIIADV